MPSIITRCERMFRLGRMRPAHARSSGSERLLRIRSLAGYIIGTLESRFRKRQAQGGLAKDPRSTLLGAQDRQVLNRLPKSQQAKGKRALEEIWMAETKKDAL